ncbi:granulin b isoform X1 [Osmerus eperlanus]|uniref:granulin b isoform X1 n=1 Tax=Osmerus eperlanus TaxID=29151 RepID=UPI002E0D78A0
MHVGLLFLALVGLTSALICPDGGMCEDGNTCCKTPSSGYGCCPLPKAECCEDHLHCCYEGTVCDLVHFKCLNKTISLPWVKKVPAKNPTGSKLPGQEVKAVVCPDKESECPDDTTCCQLLDGSWGCCPLARAVCCEDKMHCCPEDTKCDVVHSKCLSPTLESFPMFEKLPARRREAKHNQPAVSKAVTCPGGKSRCPESTTCCLLTSGDYGCCPYSEAVCCSDHQHCCPSNTTCDLEHEICTSPESHSPLAKKFSAIPNDVVCPDQISTCPDDTTCCQLGSGSYGCCPMASAVCCSDHVHCCPKDTMCDLTHSMCVSANGETPMATKIPARVAVTTLQNTVNAVPCNESVACADGSTCCKALQGDWACCPLPKAVCCDDHLHCCPHDTICNLASSTCDDPDGNAMLPWLAKVPAFPWASATPDSKCDASTFCPGKATCCKTLAGGWACCPLVKAVCCDDHTHCCPHDTVCNMEASTCDDPSSSGLSLPWVSKVPALTLARDNEKCDKETMCPGGTTCCQQNSGQWACCPLPHAVCCDDHEHCCPKGYTCDVSQQACDKPGALNVPWVRKTPALNRASAHLNAPEPRTAQNMCNAHTSCPKDTTCCFMNKAGKWGCCPLPNAVCCSDGDHCCPSDYTCDSKRTSCTKGTLSVPWYRKEQSLAGDNAVADVKCDDKSSCASGATCCKLPTGEWGCCPLVKAVCCTDHEHCCPQGYSCNMQTGTCEKKMKGPLLHSVPLSRVEELRQRAADRAGDVPCDGTGQFRCTKQDTCCKASATEWACCPSPQAVCCLDGKHCCPMGYTCDLVAGGCSMQAQLTWGTFFTDKKSDFLPFGL